VTRKSDPLPHATTLHVKQYCLCLAAQRAARALARRFDAAFAPFDLTNGQFSLMMALNRPEPPLMRDVAQLLAMDRTTLTAALKPLERRGLVRVAVDKADRRGRRLTLTAAGKRLLVKAYPVWEKTLSEVERALPDAAALRADLWAIT
jgi:DNA-binding MarR family transcriptional regulator